MKDIAWLYPSRFNEFNLLQELLEDIMDILVYYSQVKKEEIRKELLPFFRHYGDYNKSLPRSEDIDSSKEANQGKSRGEDRPLEDEGFEEESEDKEKSKDEQDDEELLCKVGRKCKRWLSCALELLC